MDKRSTLGTRTNEVALALTEFQEKVKALDEAIGRTDLQAIDDAVLDLKQVQLAVLRVEGAASSTIDGA